MSSTPTSHGRPPGRKKKRGPTPSLAQKETGSHIPLRSLKHADQKTYFRDKMKQCRSSSSPSLPRESPTPKRRALSIDNKEKPNQPGRPPLDPEHGPMKENSIKERKRELMKRQRQKEKISMVRSTAVSFRWDKTKRDKEGNTEEDGNLEADESVEPGIDPSPRTVRRYEAELKELVPASLQRQGELLKKMAQEYDGCGVSIEQRAGSRETPKATFARYQASISKFFENARAKFASLPLILIKSWAQYLIKADASIFESCGLYFTDKGDVPVSVLAKQESDKIWNSIIKNKKRNDIRNL